MKNMKKIFSIFSVLFLALVLVACKKDEAVDPAQEKLDNAYDTVMVLFENPQEITSNLSLPTSMAGGVTVEWSSSEPGAASVGTPSGGFVTITINRTPGVDTNAVLTAKFSIPAENSDEILTRSRDIPIKIIASADLNIPRGNIGEILAIVHPESDPSNKADKLDVNLQNVTIFAQGEGSVVFGYDGTGIIQFYGGTNEWEVGKVYNVSGLLEWYFGIWEVIDPVATLVEDATPQFPEKETITDPNAFVADLVAAGEHKAASGDVTDGNFEPIWATVTGTVFMSNDNTGDNYNTFLLTTGFDETKPGVPGEAGKPAAGFMFYYGTNGFRDVRAMNTFEVTMEVVIYTYRSNNNAFAVYFTGDEIELGELTDEQVVEVDKGLLELPLEVLKSDTEDASLSLITEGANGSTISWTLKDEAHSALVDVATGKVTIPETGQTEVKLTATITKGEESDTKEFTVYIGAVQTFDIADLYDVVSGRTVTITGTVLGTSANRTVSIQDATGAIALYGSGVDEEGRSLEGIKFGDLITVTGKKDFYNGLHQVGNFEVVGEAAEGTIPAAVNLDDAEKLDEKTLLPYQSQFVSISNLEVTSLKADDYGTIEMTLKRVDGQTINFRWDNRVKYEGQDELKAIKVGDFVTLTNAPLGWSRGPQLAVDRDGQIKVVTELPADIAVAIAKRDLTITRTITETGKLTLPETLKNVTVTWALKNDADADAVNLETGDVIVDPENPREVVLVATLTKGEETDTKEFTLELSNDPLVLASNWDFGNTAVTGYSAGELKWTNTDDSEVTINKDRVQINVSNFAPHNEEHFIVMSIRNTHSEAWFEIDLTKNDDVRRISFDINVWNNQNLDAVKDVEDGLFILQVKDGDNWVNLKTTNNEENLLPLLTFEEYVTVNFDVEGAGLYRVIYSGNSTASGNTTTAIALDNLKIFE